MDYLFAIILGIVEGVTEFLPISSTGHLIVATALLGFPTAALDVPDPKAFRDTFDIFIQLGAILAVSMYFGRDLLRQARTLPSNRETQRFWLNIVVAFVPAGIIGYLLRDWVTANLFRPVVVGIALIVGGIVFLLIESRPRKPTILAPEAIRLPHALLIGIAQVVALIPGVSRSGASIIGGLLGGLDRKSATTFSFYLAIPTLGIATVYELLKALSEGYVTGAHLPLFALGAAVAFVVAWASIAWLLRYVAGHDFKVFGVYRIIAGLIIILLAQYTTLLG